MPPETAASLIAPGTTAAPPAAPPAAGTAPPAAPPATGSAAPAPGATGAAPPAFAWPEAHKALADKYQNDPVKVIGALADAQKFIGADKSTLLQLPKDGDTVAEAAFFNKLGRPEAPDGYKLEGELAKDPAIAGARSAAHALGLTQKQFEGFAKWFADTGAGAQEAQEKAFGTQADKDMAELRQTWGAGTERQIGAARATVQKLGLDAAQLDKIERAIGTKAMMEKFALAGQALIEGKATSGTQPGSSALTPEQASAELRVLAKDREFQKRLAANDAEANRRIAELTAWRAGMAPGDYAGAIGAGRGMEKIGRV